MERRLTAILATDVVAYSRLMSESQDDTIAALRLLRNETFEPVVADNNGTVVKRMGDGWIVEFASVADAVQCARRVQENLQHHDTIQLRMGIHVGDVVFEAEDVFGDGVNVAARLEELAEPGEVVISDSAHNSLDGKTSARFTGGDSQQLKNIPRSVQVWRWSAKEPGTEPNTAAEGQTMSPSVERPSLAVLPFDNMSGDPEQGYFADGLTEDLITALSKLPSLFVIARNSTFAYKGKATDIRQIARDLGVRYVLEGSVRRGGDRLRITGQLIEAETGQHIWADKFDGLLEDVFDLQDEMNDAVVGALQPQLLTAEIERARRKRPENLDAYDLYLRALPHIYAHRPEPMAKALTFLRQAIEKQPDFAPALAYAAFCYQQRFAFFWPGRERDDKDEACRLARAAIAADRNNAESIGQAAFVLATLRQYDEALDAARHALQLNPNSATVCWTASWVLIGASDPAEAIPLLQRIQRLSPNDPLDFFILTAFAGSYLYQEKFEFAVEYADRSIRTYGEFLVPHFVRAAALGHIGEPERSAEAVASLRELLPGANVAGFARGLAQRYERHRQIMIEGLRKAGLPEEFG